MAFRNTGMQKIFPEEITQQGIVEEDLFWWGGGSNLQENLNLKT